jgi:probable selenium-dependent hydroxylase accessory protein YqeC
MYLPEVLASERGTTAVVGAGGKTSTMYQIASRLDRAVVTTTVHIPIFDDEVSALVVTDDPQGAIAAAEAWPLGVVPGRGKPDRYRGYDRETVPTAATAERADAVLVKADGARDRLLKAPGENEPQIPPATDTVLPLSSVQVIGKPLTDEFVHRPERVAALTDCSVGDEIEAADVATVLAHERGALAGVPSDATVVPVLNMVDDARLHDVGHTVADLLVERLADMPQTTPRVVLTRMIDDDPIVDVVPVATDG